MVYWVTFIPKEGQDLLAREMIMGGQKIDYQKMCRLPFGLYEQVHNENKVRNTMEARTSGAINLGPKGNSQGGHRFLNLITGEVIVRRSWIELPIPTEVIL